MRCIYVRIYALLGLSPRTSHSCEELHTRVDLPSGRAAVVLAGTIPAWNTASKTFPPCENGVRRAQRTESRVPRSVQCVV